MRRRFVSLATDAAPTYAVWAPVAIRLWRRWGYKAILAIDDRGWDTEAGQVILDELRQFEVAVVAMGPAGRLSVANTMRCARLVGAAQPFLDPEDFVLTADVDMMPLDGAFFDRAEPLVVLRALFQAWLGNGGRVPRLSDDRLRPGEFRFPLCYVGATTAIWRDLFPEIVVGEAGLSLDRVVGDAPDAVDLDEALVSRRLLAHPRAQAPLEALDPAGVWRKGELVLVDPLTAPLLSSYPDMPRGMLRLNDFWAPGTGSTPPAGAIDYIPFRFYPGSRPWGCLDVIAAYVPAERDWLAHYRARVEPLL